MAECVLSPNVVGVLTWLVQAKMTEPEEELARSANHFFVNLCGLQTSLHYRLRFFSSRPPPEPSVLLTFCEP